MRPVIEVLLIVYLWTMPFYAMTSGLPQPSDVVLCLVYFLFWFYCFSVLNLPIRTGVKQFTFCLMAFVAYVAVVNAIWAAVLSDFHVLVYPLFYLFNLFAFMLIVSLRADYAERTLRLIAVGVIVSVLLQAGLSFVVKSSVNTSGIRQVLFFNNPNQLGYYALLCACTIALLREKKVILPILYVISMLACIWLVCIALSKAALLSISFLLAIEITRRRIVVPIVLLLVVMTMLFVLSIDFSLFNNVASRFLDIGAASDDSLAGRGYDRIWMYPEYLFVGAGEGAVYRFKETISLEMHSTFGTVLFSYGLVGAGMLVVGFVLLLSRVDLRVGVYLVPVALYGLTHNGIRDTMLWILMALVATEIKKNRKSISDRCNFGVDAKHA